MPKVAVVGAGLAGLTIAYRIIQKGYDVDLYEARPRIGGRVHTVLIKNLDDEYSIAELGGQNIADGGEAENILTLAHELNVEHVKESYPFTRSFYDAKIFHEYSSLISKIPFSNENLEKRLEDLAKIKWSMQEVLDELFPKRSPLKRSLTFMLNSYEGSPPHLLAPTNSLGTLCSMLSGGFSPAHGEALTVRELSMQCFRGGNVSLLQKISEKIENRIHLNKILLEVSYFDSRNISLKFQDGISVNCDKLILALPASLYEDLIFHHEIISEEQLSLIKKVQLGNNSKIMIPFEARNIEHNVLFSDYMSAFFNFDHKIMNMYFINDDASNNLAKKHFQNGLKLMRLGHKESIFSDLQPVHAQDKQLEKYDTPVVKSWINDIYAKGSYSNYGVALQRDFDKVVTYKNIEVKEIFRPVNDKVFFVGEHTTLIEAIGTMEAAVESAERIAKLF